MSAKMQVPLSQRRHTNIAVVRYTKNGVKLEIACYKNKVISYRSGLEDRLDEVLQVDRIFSNVGRGFMASEKDIQTVFGKDMTEEEAIKFMLEHGELQVAQQERTAEIDELFKDIAVIISQKCINEATQRPFPTPVIEQALRSIGAAVKLDQPVKKQALAFIHQLIDSQIIPIARAKMKVRCTVVTEEARDSIIDWCQSRGVDVIQQQPDEAVSSPSEEPSNSVLVLMQPHLFREMENFVKNSLPRGSAIYMMDTAATDESASPAVPGCSRSIPLDRPAASESDDEETGKKRGGKKANKRGNARRGESEREESVKEGLDHVLQNLTLEDADDSDEGGKKGKKGKRKKKGGAEKPASSSPVPAEHVDYDSDAEVEGNRRQRKKLNNVKSVNQYNGDDEDLWNEDWEE